MKKNLKCWWTTGQRLTIVVVLFLSVQRPVIGADNADDLAVRLAETELALQTAQERVLELQSTLRRREQEMEQLRADHVRVILDLKTLRDEYGALRLKGANLLSNADDLTTAKTLDQVLRDLDSVGSLNRESLLLLAEYGRSVNSAFDLLAQDPDGPIRLALKTKEDVILRKLQEAERLSTGKGAGNSAVLKTEGRVMAVNDALKVVVLDVGRDQGALPGSVWQIAVPNTGVVTVQIIEARPSLSAAAVISGKLPDVSPGALAERVKGEN